jgi:hypothetical protein
MRSDSPEVRLDEADPMPAAASRETSVLPAGHEPAGADAMGAPDATSTAGRTPLGRANDASRR